MSFTCRVDKTQKTGFVTLDGVINCDTFIGVMETLYRHPDWRPGYSALWDGREIKQLLIDPDDLKRILAIILEYRPMVGPGRAAFVMPRDLDYVITRLVLHRGGTPERERRTFPRLEPALEWLAEAGNTRPAA